MDDGQGFDPPDDVTFGERYYLLRRYPADEAEERRQRLSQTLRRLIRKGRSPKELHRAIMAGIDVWDDQAVQQKQRKSARAWHAKIERARKDVDRALASLRALVQTPSLTDDDLFLNRDLLFRSPFDLVPGPRGRPKGAWKQAAEDALKQAGVGTSDRRELLSAIGFVEDE